ncbi:MAG: hypothetical protein N2447_05110 [Thermoanaerobaculum sp.]|nr:hypothetical protein [Thermoanaerobaculum sp.]
MQRENGFSGWQRRQQLAKGLFALVLLMAGCATVDFSARLPKGPLPTYESHEATYTSLVVQGETMLVGMTDGYAVGVILYNKPLRAFVVFVNLSEKTELVGPGLVYLEALYPLGRGQFRSQFVGTYTAEEYEAKVRNEQAWAAALYGLAAGLANMPQASSTYVSGSTPYGSFYGVATTYPTTQQYLAGAMAAQAQTQAFVAGLDADFQYLQSVLLRKNTLFPKKFVGGVVYFEARKAPFYHLYVWFGPKCFVFHYK